jgi:A/G-specific adenine glycosylase
MLQQTPVTTVIPYFRRFVKQFPTLSALAASRRDEVLRTWEGLGYYRRAHQLHRAACLLKKQGYRAFPNEPAIVRALPGVGRYILGAVLSQAFDRRLPIVETNSERVLCRLFGYGGDPRKAPLRRRLWETAEKLLPRRHVGDFNQALMELGALVCTVTRPQCDVCPLSGHCLANRQGLQRMLPLRSQRAAVVEEQEITAVIRRGRHVLLVQRPEGGRWGGMWEFPRGPVGDDESLETAVRRMMAEKTGLSVRLGPKLLTVRHAVNHHQITLTCFCARYSSGAFRSRTYRRARWLTVKDFATLPFSSPQRRLARAVSEVLGRQEKKEVGASG